MPRTLHLTYGTPGDLAAHMAQAELHDALMISLPAEADVRPQQFDRLKLALHIGATGSGEVEVEVLQLLGAAGLVVQVVDKGAAAALARWAQASRDPAPPVISWEAPEGYGEQVLDEELEVVEGDVEGDEAVVDDEDDEGDGEGDGDGKTVVKGHQLPAGMSPRSWPIEKLRQEWDDLTVPQRIQVARLGKKPARRMIAQMNDKKLTLFLLLNPQITVDEVASLANNPSLDPELVRRIANAPEWTRHPSIARALICHPRLPIQMITRLIERQTLNDLRKLVRSGRLRASVKRVVVRKLDRGGR